jgi:hypothetical protein
MCFLTQMATQVMPKANVPAAQAANPYRRRCFTGQISPAKGVDSQRRNEQALGHSAERVVCDEAGMYALASHAFIRVANSSTNAPATNYPW